jgi:hypothetical protein
VRTPVEDVERITRERSEAAAKCYIQQTSKFQFTSHLQLIELRARRIAVASAAKFDRERRRRGEGRVAIHDQLSLRRAGREDALHGQTRRAYVNGSPALEHASCFDRHRLGTDPPAAKRQMTGVAPRSALDVDSPIVGDLHFARSAQAGDVERP